MVFNVNGSSQKAVDGNYNTNFIGPDGSCSATWNQWRAWWAVDMGQERIKASVTVTNIQPYGK